MSPAKHATTAHDKTLEASAPQKEVSYDGKTYDTIKEGLAEILIPKSSTKTSNGSRDGKSKSGHNDGNATQAVFYNPIQQYNRDLSVLAIKAFADDLAAVRLAKRIQKEQHQGQVEGRGKKRKRKGNEHTNKKIKASEDPAATPTTDAQREDKTVLESAVEVPAGDNGWLLVGADGECKDVDEFQELQENGEAEGNSRVGENNANAEIGVNEAEASLTGAETTTAPKGPRNSTNGDPLPFRILDALSATGLRALRYAKEIPMTTSVTANDLSPTAAESIKLNVAHNSLTSRIVVSTSNAVEHMQSTQVRTNGRMPISYHVIDLDPYGTATPFLDAAVQSITDGGLLCVTCTDAGVFASRGYSEKTFSQYGGLPIKGPHAHEAGLRLILHAIATSAARYGNAIEPLLSLSIDFYARVFVRVHHRPVDVKFLASKTMTVYQCDEGCGSWTTQFMANAKLLEGRNGETFYKFTGALGPSAGKECEHCGFKTHLAGPMWGGALHNSFFVQRILDMLPDLDPKTYPTIPRIEGMLTLALEEGLDDPWASTAHLKNLVPTNDSPIKGSKPPTTDAVITNRASSTNEHHNPTLPPTRSVPPIPAHYRTHHPFFIHIPSLARALGTNCPSDASIRGALRHLGYLTSRSHTKPGSIVANAPFAVIWEIMREWVRQDCSNRSKPLVPPRPKTAAAGIMRNDRSRCVLQKAQRDACARIEEAKSVEEFRSELQAALYRLDNPNPSHPVAGSTTTTATANPSPGAQQSSAHPSSASPDTQTLVAQTPQHNLTDLHALDVRFDEQLGKDPRPVGSGTRGKMIRYQENPRENWGPLGRAKG